jgi:hypothetical protein
MTYSLAHSLAHSLAGQDREKGFYIIAQSRETMRSSPTPLQVAPLPLSSGGGAPTQTQKEMEKTNTTLTMLLAQSTADAAFDPPSPPPITAPRVLEAFCSKGGISHPAPWLLLAGVALIVYGIVSD